MFSCFRPTSAAKGAAEEKEESRKTLRFTRKKKKRIATHQKWGSGKTADP